MALKDDIPAIFKEIDQEKYCLAHNHTLFNIYEGDLLTYVLEDLAKQLSAKSFEQIKCRVSPVNILKRLNDKQSKIYKESPLRELNIANSNNVDLFAFYLNSMQPDNILHNANEFFNLFKNTLIEPYVYKGKPKLRTIPSDRFFVYSNDLVNPTCPTHVVKFMGKTNLYGNETEICYVYSDSEFLITDGRGNILRNLMNSYGNPEGINVYGKLPFVYVNRSKHLLIPQADTDSLAMTKLIPILLSDLNYAVMYQSFSIIYGIDIDFDNLNQSPNALWSFKSDPTSDKKPEIGSIKPQVDITQVLEFVNSQIQLWFQTKGIKPGAIGNLTTENAASGIAKAIDEADTSEDRSIQTKYFKAAEEELWSLIIDYMHPVWVTDPNYEVTNQFSVGTSVTVTFPKQKPIVDESTALDNVIKKMNSGLSTKKMALQELYPDLSEQDIDDMMTEIEDESTVEVSAAEAPSQTEQNDT